VSTGAVLFANNSITVADLQTGGVPAQRLDLINVEGNLSFAAGSTLTLNLVGAPGSLGSGTKLALMDYTGFSWDGDAFSNRADNSVFDFGGNRWTIRYDDTTDGVNTGNFVTLTIATPYESWAADQTPALLADSQTSDADLDGVPNLVEYGFDTDPNNGASGPNDMAYDGGGTGGVTHGQPVLERSGNQFHVVFCRRLDRVAAGLSYTLQFSADNQTWVNYTGGTQTVVDSDATVEAVRVQHPIFVEVPGEGFKKMPFFRVAVTLAP
jgi:hypothetical protein